MLSVDNEEQIQVCEMRALKGKHRCCGTPEEGQAPWTWAVRGDFLEEVMMERPAWQRRSLALASTTSCHIVTVLPSVESDLSRPSESEGIPEPKPLQEQIGTSWIECPGASFFAAHAKKQPVTKDSSLGIHVSPAQPVLCW